MSFAVVNASQWTKADVEAQMPNDTNYECRSAAPFLKNEVESPLKRDNQVSPSLSPQSLATAGGESPVTSAPPVTPTHTSENASLGSDIGDDSDFADLQDCVIQEKIVVPAPIDNTLAENAHTEDVSDVSASDDLSASGAEEVVIVQVNRSINVAPKLVPAKRPLKFQQHRTEWWTLSAAEEGRSAQELWGLSLTPDVPTRVIRKLGQGGFGAVYLVEFLEDGAWVERALKVMEHKSSCKRSFDTEVATSLTLQGLGDRVSLVLSSCETPMALFLTYQYYELGSLADYDFDDTEILVIAGSLCATLADIHARGVAHADIKPDNILLALGEDGEVFPVVADLGLCQSVMDYDIISGAGTPAFMAPEIWTCKQTRIGWGVAVDIYALGIMLHLLSAGCYWYQQYDETEFHDRKTKGFDAQWWAGVSHKNRFDSSCVRDLVAACCSPDPAERPTAQALCDDIQALVDYEKQGGSLSDPADVVYAWIDEHMV